MELPICDFAFAQGKLGGWMDGNVLCEKTEKRWNNWSITYNRHDDDGEYKSSGRKKKFEEIIKIVTFKFEYICCPWIWLCSLKTRIKVETGMPSYHYCIRWIFVPFNVMAWQFISRGEIRIHQNASHLMPYHQQPHQHIQETLISEKLSLACTAVAIMPSMSPFV